MDDIAGRNWASTTTSGQKSAVPTHPSAFSTLRPTPPTSGRASPFSAVPAQPPSKPATPANDSFSNLVSFGGNGNKNISLQEQQKRLADLKLQQQIAQHKALQDQYAGADDTFWNNLGSGRGTPATDNPRNAPSVDNKQGVGAEGDDPFAVFNATSGAGRPAPSGPAHASGKYEDDDPFGLSQFSAHRTDTDKTTESQNVDDDDDNILGLLGRPVTDRPKPDSPPPNPVMDTPEAHPQDKAVAELVDMGFPADKARQALEATESGTDVQAAVGLLLNQAHAEARQRAQARGERQRPAADGVRRGSERSESQTTRHRRYIDEEGWADDEGIRRSRPHRSPAQAVERDAAQIAAELGNNFLKTANSLWKQGAKRVQQAVQEFNSDSDSGQPKWMRETDRLPRTGQRPPQGNDEIESARPRRRRSSSSQQPSMVTNEALMLESERPSPPPKLPVRPRPEPRFDANANMSHDHSHAVFSHVREAHAPQPAFLRQTPQSPASSSKAGLNRKAIEEQAAQAYVSSARRRRPAAEPTPAAPVSSSEPDLFDGAAKSTIPVTRRPATPAARQPATPTADRPTNAVDIPVRPARPARTIPPVSAISLKACHSHREKGNEHFKRGDYPSAHQSYTTSLSHLPPAHPIIVVLLTNRALTALKIGEPKTAIADADRALGVIGPSKGESETVDFGNGEAAKPMRDYYGKALMRKAEALEQMERWADAAAVWQEAVQAGHGGATSIQGRIRAEKAANPHVAKPKPTTLARPAPVPKRAAVTAANKGSSVAVSRLRAANAAAEKAEDEKFALSDSVDARIAAWKGGKADNLRALLASLDTALWPEAGWKKISMADLVLPGKVKIQYMKGIAKVHPDKVSVFAS